MQLMDTSRLDHCPEQKRFACIIHPCPKAPDFYFPTAAELAKHLRDHHKPIATIPSTAIAAGGLVRCRDCYKFYTTKSGLRGHVLRDHPRPADLSPNQGPAEAADSPAGPNTATQLPAVEAADQYTPPTAALHANQPFLLLHPPDSPTLLEISSGALPHFPEEAGPAILSMYRVTLNAMVSDLSNDQATSLFHLLPRLLLFPPPKDEARRCLPDTIQRRVVRLCQGHASELYGAHDWNAHTIPVFGYHA